MARFATAVLAVAIVGQAQAQARTPMVDPFCRDLRRIVAAADENPPFASLPSGQDDVWMGGEASCHRVTQPAASFHCRMRAEPAPGGRSALAARAQHCLGAAVRELDPDSRDHHDRRLTRLHAGSLIVDVAEEGGPGVHIGWYYSLDVRRAD